jgi:hypothetical protein
MNTTMKAPEILKFLDPEEKELVQSVEAGGSLFKSGLTPKRRCEIESMARAAISDERARISLSDSKRDLVRLKSRALWEGVSYQALINALIHRYVSD